jgi:Co/Zn/Cd efflux system component
MAHNHPHAPTTYNSAFLIGTSLNISFVLVEAWFGVITNSLALLADAGHNLSDVLGLLLAWGASYLVQRPPNRRVHLWTAAFFDSGSFTQCDSITANNGWYYLGSNSSLARS